MHIISVISYGYFFCHVQRRLIGNSAKLSITGRVFKNQKITFLIESNPSTGYQWQFIPKDYLLHQEGLNAYESRGFALGASVKQTLVIHSDKEGLAEISLSYARPWTQGISANEPEVSLNYARLLTQGISANEPDVVNQVTIQAGNIPGIIDLSDPNPVVESAISEMLIRQPSNAPISKLVLTSLPASWDWRNQGTGLTDVRDQGNCGSCWAFSTVGAMESALKVKSGRSTDLSEQFLVSCTTNNFGCDGGWFAHDYHLAKLALLQNAAGAVLEADMPYTASNGNCKVIANHSNRISAWHYITDAYTIPTVDQIKNAIYSYGPISANVCIGSNFLAYRGGVFSTEERSVCNKGPTNHAIVLVGWDNATQSWILRNSWGALWGEQGYMRIKWGTSNIGLAANYVEVPVTKNSVPLKLYWSSQREDNFVTGTNQGENDALGAGYRYIRNEACIFSSPQPGTIPLNLYWHSGRGDNFTTATNQGASDAKGAGYALIRTEGYIYSNQQPGTILLNLYWHSGRGDNFTTATNQGASDAKGAGYVLIRTEGYAYPASSCIGTQ